MFSTYRCTGNLCIFLLVLFLSLSVIIYALFYAKTQEQSKSSGPRASETLKFLVVISRHGNRRPLATLPNESVHWNYGLGDLTTFGRINSFNLGVRIRSLYDGFLNTEYQSSELFAQSTAIDRTMMSGELFLAGLYPPEGYQVWISQLRWQPIPVYSNSPDMSEVVQRTKICPRLVQEITDSQLAFERDNADSLNSLNSYLSKQLGYNVTGSTGLYRVWDVLYCEEGEGFPLPDWSKAVYPEPIEELQNRSYIARCAATPTIIRLSIGPLFQEVADAMKKKINGTLSPDRKLYYYSGHDTSIIGLQGLLGIPKESIIGLVRPSSALILELHQSPQGNFYVQVVYIDGDSLSMEPRLLELPLCGSPCDINTLFNITHQYTNISDYQQECQIL